MILGNSVHIDIAEIHERVYPADVLNLFGIVPEQNRGKRQGGYKVRCPFHDDSDPSMQVYADGVYCFGCGWSGDVVKLYMALARVDFLSALLALADLFSVPSGLPLPIASSSQTISPIGMWPAPDVSLEQKCIEWHNVLMSDEGASVRDYLLSRCITEDAMRLWQLGYRRLPRPALVIPVHDDRKHVVTVRFRALPGDTSGPRYWGLKGKNDQYLFGWAYCLDAAEFWGNSFVFLLEGELDLIAFHSATGLPAVTITSGAVSLSAWIKWQPYLDKFRLWIAAMDADPDPGDGRCPPGQKAVFDLMAHYGPRVIAFRWPPPFGQDKKHKDMTDLLIHGGPDSIWHMVDKIVSLPDAQNNDRQSLSLHYPALNVHYPRLYRPSSKRNRRRHNIV